MTAQPSPAQLRADVLTVAAHFRMSPDECWRMVVVAGVHRVSVAACYRAIVRSLP